MELIRTLYTVQVFLPLLVIAHRFLGCPSTTSSFYRMDTLATGDTALRQLHSCFVC